jgi:hypothetical protein
MRVHLNRDVLAVLADARYCTAIGIAERLGEDIDDVYGSLIALEAKDMARVVVEYRNGDRVAIWEAK